MKCACCGKKQTTLKKQWWHLINYYGLSGTFCSECYDKVSHNADGKPYHPVAYRNVLKKICQQFNKAQAEELE